MDRILYIYWMATFAGIWNSTAALDLIIVGCVIGIPVLVVVYIEYMQDIRPDQIGR